MSRHLRDTFKCRCGNAKEKFWHLLCAACWARLPKELQDEVYEAYAEKEGSPRHVTAIRECFENLRDQGIGRKHQ